MFLPTRNLATPSRLLSPATRLVYKTPVVARRNLIRLPAAFLPSSSASPIPLPQANSSSSGLTPTTFSNPRACDTHPSDRADRLLHRLRPSQLLLPVFLSHSAVSSSFPLLSSAVISLSLSSLVSVSRPQSPASVSVSPSRLSLPPVLPVLPGFVPPSS